MQRFAVLLAGLLLWAVVPSPARADVLDPVTGAAGLGDPYYPLDGNGGYDVTHYDLDLTYDPPSHHLAATARIDATATQLLAAFNLDFSGPPVRMITVNGLPAGFETTGDHELTVRPLLPVLPGLPMRVVVDYAGEAADTEGEGWTRSPGGGAFVIGEPHGAASWYPLNDTPLDKAGFALRVTVPEGWEVMSNGLRTEHTVRDGLLTTSWVSRHPVLGYLTTVAIDRFTFLEQRRPDGTELLSAFAPGAEKHRENEQRVPEILDFLESLYGRYPFEVAGGIYVDAEMPFSLETQTRPVYAPWTDLNTVVHELTHQWWGDSMSVRRWSDICLNECFASYTADYLWLERIDKADVDTKYRDTVAEVRDEPEFWEIPLADPGADNEFTSVYYRGPLFLHALRKLIGDDVFFTAVGDFVRAHAYGNASMPEFRDFVQGRTSLPLSEFFAAWLDRTEPPPEPFLYPGSLAPR
ncbi:M1 family metallopeptidase [Nocardia thailandica]|uniref:Aminopeptidase N n=1 Tax=Nocardia thailandica TaxID=257275 RepID=A0ABW6PJ40_9NOCA